ncbi:MAG TPA: prolipoprotein diacylglyceryl transferase family protein [Candidatus Limnocylindrales bacterium]|nr:prolipoprotein diacylglyceryl transferase family protein [Candidatus Limnocylindrales bacterium]
MPPAVLTFAFDPLLRIGDSASVRIEVIVLEVVFLAGIALAVRIGHQTPTVGPYVPAPGLAASDLMFILVGSVPGAIVGGRLGYVVDHLDFYRANPNLIVDPTQGGFGLTLAVPFGILTGGIIAWLIGAPVARWMHAVAYPLLFVLATGKLAGLFGASGQGLPSDLPWATAYVGPGPWDSLAADVPSHPAAAYEAILVVVAIGGLVLAQRLEVVARRDGAALFVAVGLWGLARFAVAFTWRDDVILGPLRVDQALALLVVGLAAVGFVERWRAPLQAVSRVEPEPEPEREPEPEPAE